MGQLVDLAGIDIALVGDSLAMVVLGLDDTVPVTMDVMLPSHQGGGPGLPGGPCGGRHALHELQHLHSERPS